MNIVQYYLQLLTTFTTSYNILTNIAFTGWWTWGHITPIASLIEYGLQNTEITRDCKLFRFGEANSMESKTASTFPEVTFIAIPAGKLRRYWTLQSTRHNIRDARKWIAWVFVAWKKLYKHKIDKVFCKWWYVALPVCIAAYILRIPIIVHESDTHAGMTNRFAARMATKVFTWFPNSLPKEHVIGQLLSPALLDPNESLVAELTQTIWTKTAVLVMGGSQWAATLFDRLVHRLEQNTKHAFHFLVILWSKNTETYHNTFDTYQCVTPFGFINAPEDMASLYTVSDVSITRGSATSLAEQHCFGIRKIIVPTPHTWWNHQRWNGLWYEKTYNDILIEQNNDMSTKLDKAIHSFYNHKKSVSSPDSLTINETLIAVRHELSKEI